MMRIHETVREQLHADFIERGKIAAMTAVILNPFYEKTSDENTKKKYLMSHAVS